MYSREDKLKAVELFAKYDFSSQSVINELGSEQGVPIQLVQRVPGQRRRNP